MGFASVPQQPFENRAMRRARLAGKRKPTKMAPAFWKRRDRGGRHRPALQPIDRSGWRRETTWARDSRGGEPVRVFAWAVEYAPWAPQPEAV